MPRPEAKKETNSPSIPDWFGMADSIKDHLKIHGNLEKRDECDLFFQSVDLYDGRYLTVCWLDLLPHVGRLSFVITNSPENAETMFKLVHYEISVYSDSGDTLLDHVNMSGRQYPVNLNDLNTLVKWQQSLSQ